VTGPPTSGVDHRRLAVELFNHVWTLLELASRTPEQDDELVHAAHASRWLLVEGRDDGQPRPRRVADLARLRRARARRARALARAPVLAYVEAADDAEDWDLPFAYEALARASFVAGDIAAAAGHAAEARELGERIVDPEDRELLEKDLATLPFPGDS
jgi:hypothetical protein